MQVSLKRVKKQTPDIGKGGRMGRREGGREGMVGRFDQNYFHVCLKFPNKIFKNVKRKKRKDLTGFINMNSEMDMIKKSKELVNYFKTWQSTWTYLQKPMFYN